MYLDYLQIVDHITLQKFTPNYAQVKVLFGHSFELLSKVLFKVAPYLKVAVIYTVSGFSIKSEAVTKVVKSNQNRLINVIADIGEDFNLKDLDVLLHLPEDIRAIITFDECNFNAVRYVAKIRNIPSICVCQNLSTFNIHPYSLSVRHNKNIDYVLLENAITIVDDRASITPKTFELAISNALSVLDVKTYSCLFDKNYSQLLNYLQIIYGDKQNFTPKHIRDTFYSIDLILSLLPKRVKDFSCLEVAKKLCNANQLDLAIQLLDYVCDKDLVSNVAPTYYERAKVMSEKLDLSYLNCLEKQKKQLQTINENKELLPKLYQELVELSLIYKDFISGITKSKQKKGVAHEIGSCGDYEFNAMTVVREIKQMV